MTKERATRVNLAGRFELIEERMNRIKSIEENGSRGRDEKVSSPSSSEKGNCV
jgi:hypothetical protein